MGLDVLVKNDS